jgi:hypothetical protein
MRGYQGKVFGNTTSAMLRKDIEYNFKFNLEPDEAFFDETEGYLTADFDLVKFKLGRDRLLIGYGNMRPLLSDNPPMFDYLSLNFNYKFLNFSYFHGKILGERFFENDPVTGGENIVGEKFLGYHRLGFNLSPQFNFGIGEIIVYGERTIDLSYLNPFAFYKSVEHSNQDRDNSMLFFDLNTKLVKGLKVFSQLILDDISFGKIGTGWWGNQAVFHVGLSSYNLYDQLPLDINLEYMRIEPYTYTHRLLKNNFTHSGYSIAGLQPNSELFFSQINYRFSSRFNILAGFRYVIHGANPLNSDGSIKENVGGNITLGHRISDSGKVEFLKGDLEYQRMATFGVFFEPVNLYLLSLRLIYINNSLQKSISQKEIQTFVTLTIKI